MSSPFASLIPAQVALTAANGFTKQSSQEVLLTQLTNQEIFNCVAAHLLKQGRKSAEGKHAVYHGKEGLKCAIGVLISAEDYNPDWDKFPTTVSLLLRHGKPLFPHQQIRFLAELQSIHDNVKVVDWCAGLVALATRWQLDHSVCGDKERIAAKCRTPQSESSTLAKSVE